MSRSLVLRISAFISRWEQILPQLFGRGSGQPPAAFAIAGLPGHYDDKLSWPTTAKLGENLKALLDDGFLWAVPKHRRTIEKRLNRKFGSPFYNWKPLKIKTNLRSCNQCGHDHEVGVLCPHCYEKVRLETNAMQDRIQEELGLQPIEQEVIVLYEGEKSQHSADVLNGKRIVEMPKPRPMWFSKNLLQKTTQQPATIAKEVKPTDLA